MPDNQRLSAATSQPWGSSHVPLALNPHFKTCSSGSPLTKSQRGFPRLAVSESHPHGPWAALVLGHPWVSGVRQGQLTSGAGLWAPQRAAGCLRLQGCPSSAAWWGWGAAASLSYCSLIQSPHGKTICTKQAFLQRGGYGLDHREPICQSFIMPDML